MSVATPVPSGRSAPRIQARPVPAAASSSRPVAARPTAPRTSSSTSKSAIASSSKPNPIATSSKPAKPSQPSATPSSSNPTFLVAGKDTSSSSGKVFAKPSKEWVLPERAKPGRKVAVEEPDSTRQSQNRQSQRAHRARRTDYISTLEERIRQFENDEIHSNVRLQEVARALKADNERLRAELQARPAQAGDTTPKGWGEERLALLAEVKALREEVGELRNKKGALGLIRINDRAGSMSMTPHPTSPLISPTSHSHRIRHTAECPICPDPDPDCPCQRTAGASHQRQQLPSRFSLRSNQPDPTIPLGSTINLLPSPTLPTASCGFCQSTEECLCRMIDEEEEDIKPIILTPNNEPMPLDDGCGLCADGGFCACAVARNSPSAFNHISTNSPSASAAIPLKKLRSSGKVPTRKSIWALDSGVVSATSTMEGSRSEAVCSGDPSNCDACRNDTFGQEFCSNFFSSRDPSHSCTNCAGKCASADVAGPSTHTPTPKYWSQTAHIPSPAPSTDLHPFDNSSSSGPLLMACCGNPSLCGHQAGGCSGDVIGIGGLIPGLPEKDIAHETIRVDQAWKTLKAHPNAKFASLAFLADIVAQRSGPHVANAAGPSVSGLPGSPVSPNGGASPMPRTADTDKRSMPPSKLGLVQAGSGLRDEASELDTNGKRKMVVETSAVRDALRLLDGTPAPSDDGEDMREHKRTRLD